MIQTWQQWMILAGVGFGGLGMGIAWGFKLGIWYAIRHPERGY